MQIEIKGTSNNNEKEKQNGDTWVAMRKENDENENKLQRRRGKTQMRFTK
jgi:hypothetical protein